MSKNRTSQSLKSNSNKLAKQIQTLQTQISQNVNVSGGWIKEKAQEVKTLLKTLLDKAENIPNRYDLLDQLTQIRSQLTDLNKRRKKKTDILKTPVSNHSKKSLRSRSKRQSKSISSSKVSKVSKKSRKSTKKSFTQNTPKFTKKPFSSKLNKLGSFSKEFSNKQKKITRSVSSRSMSVASSKSKKKRRTQTPESNRKRTPKHKKTYSPAESSSISLSSELKEAVQLRMNHRTNPATKAKYEALIDGEKKSNELDGGHLSREENLLLTTKLESITKEKLLREYRILFYRSKEIRKLLAEYYEQNLQLNDQIEDQKQQLIEHAEMSRKYKKELKETNKQMKHLHQDYTSRIEQMTHTFQQQEFNTVPMNEYEHLKLEGEKCLIENAMLKEDNKMLSQKLQSYDQEFQSRRFGETMESGQRLQNELTNLREQMDRVREENMRLKMQLDKELLSNRELAQQMNQKRTEVEGTVEQKHYELNSMKQIVQNAQQKIQKLEGQLQQQKYQLITEQEQNFGGKERIARMEEELRIASLRVENREKELNEYRSKELVMKKKLVELECKLENTTCNNNSSSIQDPFMNKGNFEISSLNKELSSERQYLQKCQEQILQLQKELDTVTRQSKSLELDLQFEQQQSNQLKQRNQQLNEEKEIQLQRLQKQYEDIELGRQKELNTSEQQQKNQENMLYSAQQRINELEQENRVFTKQDGDKQHQINELKLLIEKQKMQLEQLEQKYTTVINETNGLNEENGELNQLNKQLRVQVQQLNKELDQIDRVKENYKSKYLNNKYESKKKISEYSEKENQLKQTYTSELERVRSEKEKLERMKQQEEQQRNQKDKKLKVINDLQQMIKGHKQQLI